MNSAGERLDDRTFKDLLSGRRAIDLLRYAGLLTWGTAAMPLLLFPWLSGEPGVSPVSYVSWWVLHLLFGVAYWFQVRNLPQIAPGLQRIAALLTMTASALIITLLSESGLGGILMLIVAVLLPWLLVSPFSLIWLLSQNVLLALAVASFPQVSFGAAATMAGLFLGVSLFAFMTSVVAIRQLRARDELSKLNSELRATQALLTENTRIAERVRIARDLHDVVGHHLTALTLNLEVATHLVEGKALEHVQQARSLAKLLLADVRQVVSDMREDDLVDIAQAMRTLVEGVPEPRIHLDLPDRAAMTDPRRAQVLLRCAQEMITNSVRHAQARNLWIRLQRTSRGLSLSAQDDGRGAVDVLPGNGLTGMDERLRQLGGKLKIESRPNAGFSLEAWMPLENKA